MDKLKADILYKLELLKNFGYNPIYNSSMSCQELVNIYTRIIYKIQKEEEYRAERSYLMNIALYLMSICPEEKIFNDIIQKDWSNDEIKIKLQEFFSNCNKETIINRVKTDMTSMLDNL